MWHIRQKEPAKALNTFKYAAERDKDNTRHQYVYAIALAEKDTVEAIKVLENSLKKHTGDIQTLFALAYYHKQLGHTMQV